jgi:hypothetical protein
MNRGFPRQVDMGTSGPPLLRKSMPWSRPRRGITGDLGLPTEQCAVCGVERSDPHGTTNDSGRWLMGEGSIVRLAPPNSPARRPLT